MGTRGAEIQYSTVRETLNHNLSFAALRSGACVVARGMQYCRSLSVCQRGRYLAAFELKEKRRYQMYLGVRI